MFPLSQKSQSKGDDSVIVTPLFPGRFAVLPDDERGHLSEGVAVGAKDLPLAYGLSYSVQEDDARSLVRPPAWPALELLGSDVDFSLPIEFFVLKYVFKIFKDSLSGGVIRFNHDESWVSKRAMSSAGEVFSKERHLSCKDVRRDVTMQGSNELR